MINSHIIQLLAPKIQTFPSGKEFIYLVGPIKLPVNLDGETHTFQWYSWMKSEKAMESRELIESLATAELAERQQSSVLVYGDFAEAQEALIRMHSICHTGDIFGSKRCDCGFQLEQSMKMIAAHGAGALFYLANHEGRGIGLFSKAMAYLLQEEGLDTVDANLQLGFTDDARNYDDAIAVLRALRSAPVTLITNNPRKLAALQEAGLNVGGRVPLWGDRSSFNEKYLQTKVSRSGHLADNDGWAGQETLLPHAQA